MPLYVCGPTALAHYRCAIKPATPFEEYQDEPLLTDALYRASDISATSLTGLALDEPSPDEPLHFMVPNKRLRPRSAVYVGHACSLVLPRGSFFHLSGEVNVASPELTFVQMACQLSMSELIALGMELCGTYRRNVIGIAVPGSSVHKTIYNQHPLTSVEKLKDFVDAAGKLPGTLLARKALKYVRNNSASPYETIVYLLLCLPRRMGGYAFPEPELNPSISFSKRGRTFTLRSGARGDLYWRDSKLDLEYNGGDHEDTRAADSMRRKALERMNVQVIELTSEEVNDVDLFHATALRIANTLGVRVRVERDFCERRAALRYDLFHDSCSTKSEQVSQNTPDYETEADYEAEYFEDEYVDYADEDVIEDKYVDYVDDDVFGNEYVDCADEDVFGDECIDYADAGNEWDGFDNPEYDWSE